MGEQSSKLQMWIICGLSAFVLILGLSVLFGGKDEVKANASAGDAMILRNAQIAEPLNSKYAKPWWHWALEKVIMEASEI